MMSRAMSTSVPRCAALGPLARSLSNAAAGTSRRARYARFERIQTRWNDMDAFGHINNAVYFEMVDIAVNNHLLAHGLGVEYPRFVAESGCRYLRPLTHGPTPVEVGLRINKLGRSSATYELGIFATGAADEAAIAKWVHVYVDVSGRPAEIAPPVREVLATLLLEAEAGE